MDVRMVITIQLQYMHDTIIYFLQTMPIQIYQGQREAEVHEFNPYEYEHESNFLKFQNR